MSTIRERVRRKGGVRNKRQTTEANAEHVYAHVWVHGCGLREAAAAAVRCGWGVADRAGLVGVGQQEWGRRRGGGG